MYFMFLINYILVCNFNKYFIALQKNKLLYYIRTN